MPHHLHHCIELKVMGESLILMMMRMVITMAMLLITMTMTMVVLLMTMMMTGLMVLMPIRMNLQLASQIRPALTLTKVRQQSMSQLTSQFIPKKDEISIDFTIHLKKVEISIGFTIHLKDVSHLN